MRLLIGVLIATVGAGADYSIAPAPNAQFKLEVLKTGLMSGKVHVFTFEKYSGQVQHSAATPEQSTVKFTVENQSIVCRDTWVSEKDRKKIIEVAHESMETEKHPEISFQSQSVVRRGDGGFDVTGPLTIKGIAKPITLKVTVSTEGSNLRFKGEGAIRRKDYDISPKSPVPFGLVGNKEEMPVHFDLIAAPR